MSRLNRKDENTVNEVCLIIYLIVHGLLIVINRKTDIKERTYRYLI